MKVRSSKGFSLIEVMIVVAILGIVLAIASFNYNKYRQNTNLREATRAVEADIALYKQKAAAGNMHYKITFNQSANNYNIQQENTLIPLTKPPTFIDLVPAVTKSPSDISSQVIISNSPAPSFAGGVPSITFEPRGTMGNGSVTLANGIGSTGKITTNLTGRMYVDFTIK